MQSKWIVKASVVALLLAAILFQTAGAGNFHFNSIEFSLGSLVADGRLSGLANDTAKVRLTGYGTVVAMCQNKGGQQAPGRNPISAEVQQTDVFTTDKNGSTLVKVTAEDPELPDFKPSPTPKEAGCPNGNWKVVDIVDGSTDWTAARIEVWDLAGNLQIDLSYTCDTTFDSNGIGIAVECFEN